MRFKFLEKDFFFLRFVKSRMTFNMAIFVYNFEEKAFYVGEKL